jgi:hypothetical protein
MGCIPMISKRAFAGRWIGCGRILGVHGLRLDLVEIASGTVRLRSHGSNAATIKAPLLWTLPGEIEDAVVAAAPDVEKILIDGLIPQEAAAAVRAAE